MSVRTTAFNIIVLAACLCLLGCTGADRLNLAERTGGSAALFGQFQAYDAHTARPVALAEVARRCAAADAILFGEEHSDAICNQLEAQLLASLARQNRPVALAMEFFETDTQADLDAYLNGRIDEAAFRERTRQSGAYVLAHRPLIEMCRTAHVPVLAANAPRRLVRAYRRSPLPYDDFRTTLDPADQRWLPVHSEHLAGPYEERFLATMQRHGPAAAPATQPTTGPTSVPSTVPASAPATAPASQPTAQPEAPDLDPASFYRAQLLWDDSMAESLADFRARFPDARVMLVVGSFHVSADGGTATKFRQRRPDDRVCTVVFRSAADVPFAFDEDDRDTGDFVIYGIAAPPEQERPGPMPAAPAPTTAPSPTSAPATAPATPPTTAPVAAPATSRPASAPAPAAAPHSHPASAPATTTAPHTRPAGTE